MVTNLPSSIQTVRMVSTDGGHFPAQKQNCPLWYLQNIRVGPVLRQTAHLPCEATEGFQQGETLSSLDATLPILVHPGRPSLPSAVANCLFSIQSIQTVPTGRTPFQSGRKTAQSGPSRNSESARCGDKPPIFRTKHPKGFNAEDHFQVWTQNCPLRFTQKIQICLV